MVIHTIPFSKMPFSISITIFANHFVFLPLDIWKLDKITTIEHMLWKSTYPNMTRKVYLLSFNVGENIYQKKIPEKPNIWQVDAHLKIIVRIGKKRGKCGQNREVCPREGGVVQKYWEKKAKYWQNRQTCRRGLANGTKRAPSCFTVPLQLKI